MDTIKNRRILELSKNVADKIAAGEVVDRPLSIVKELIENSIDAGASSIIIEIKNGGKSYIRVTDNGCGIDKEDVELAFKRHATSKIKCVSDLDSITSLGFRGEALASIAAVSRTELITKTAEEKSGIRIKIEGGEVAEKGDTGCPEGTTIIIEDLFYNIPARLKFLKQDSTESTLIIDFVSKMALAYPGIKIRLINNGNILFSTIGKGDIYTNILTIYHKEIGDSLIHLKEDGEMISVEAYVSGPAQSKTNRKSQIFFVNGRYINSKVIESGVKEAYAEKLFEGRYPMAFIFLNVAPDRLDVNIHPNKKEVRFDDERAIKEFISSTIRRHLNTEEAIPRIKNENIFKVKNNIEDLKTLKYDDSTIQNIGVVKVGEEQVDIKKLLYTQTNRSEESIAVNPAVTQVSEKEAAYIIKNAVFEYSPNKNNEKKHPGNISENVATEVIVTQKKEFKIKDIEITGSVFDTYITGVEGEDFFIIDQHAAHERVFYERLLDQYHNEEKMQQTILTPFVVNVSYAVKNDTCDMLDFLINMGFQIEEFGPKAYIVKAVPMFMELNEAKDFIDYLLDNLSEDIDLDNQKKIDKVISNACKKAVKAHDVLDRREMEQLITDLSNTKNPYSCPHGRPTFIKLSKYELEKMFKRV